MKIKNIAIVVIAYNRPHSLNRLLQSLARAHYPQPAKLIISIDKSESNEVPKLAEAFHWPHGEKEVIHHAENLGLRKHVLTCGDLTKRYDAVILLEDDLFVAPGFYSYTLQAVDFYKKDHNIGGISLYSHCYNETAQLPFLPLADNSDVFFMQLPSSWGQCWTRDQWNKFRDWYETNQYKEVTAELGIPGNVASWPATSWKKYFIWYLIHSNKYFVYPRFSLSTNCGDPGVHFHKKLLFQQVPVLAVPRQFRFVSLEESQCVYDACCEIVPESLTYFLPELKKYKFTVDLYGVKNEHQVKTPHIITTRKCSKALMTFAREIKPPENNIINRIPGDEISLARYSDCDKKIYEVHLMVKELHYFFNIRDYQIHPYTIVQKNYTMRELLAIFYRKLKEVIFGK